MMTRQEMFTKAWNGLKSQGFIPATNDGKSCRYRAADGKKCAFGHLLDDADYDSGMENAHATFVISWYRLDHKFPLSTPEDRQFIIALQGAHDQATIGYASDRTKAVTMVEGLLEVAKKYDLYTPEPVPNLYAYVDAVQAQQQKIEQLPPNCS